MSSENPVHTRILTQVRKHAADLEALNLIEHETVVTVLANLLAARKMFEAQEIQKMARLQQGFGVVPG